MNKETRCHIGGLYQPRLRETTEGQAQSRTIEGYAIVFGQESRLLSDYWENYREIIEEWKRIVHALMIRSKLSTFRRAPEYSSIPESGTTLLMQWKTIRSTSSSVCRSAPTVTTVPASAYLRTNSSKSNFENEKNIS